MQLLKGEGMETTSGRWIAQIAFHCPQNPLLSTDGSEKEATTAVEAGKKPQCLSHQPYMMENIRVVPILQHEKPQHPRSPTGFAIEATF